MLKKIQKRRRGGNGGCFAIVAAKYNAQFTAALVRFAKSELEHGGAEQIEVVPVPGSFELPVVAARLARSGQFDAVICFGAVLRGQTTHADNISNAVSVALANLQLTTGVPIIHGVLLFENEEQAKVRCLGKEHNRGTEAARTALEMMQVMRKLSSLLE